MSSSIWTQCAGEREIRPLACSALRAVEAQHVIATRKLVDSPEEQEVLEALIDSAKPPWPRGLEADGLHYLLATPFRYPPLRHGSRFGTRDQPGLWYGSRQESTALAEVAYYRLLFVEGSAANLDPLEMEISTFRVRVATDRGVDLAAPPFDAFRGAIASPTSWSRSQALGTAMREAGVELFLAPSARDPRGGLNVGLLTPGPFGRRGPTGLTSWHCTTTTGGVEFVRRSLRRRQTLVFDRELFLVDGVLPRPGI